MVKHCLSQMMVNDCIPLSSSQVVHSCLLGSSKSGMKCSIFLSDDQNQYKYAGLHGLDLRGIVSIRQRCEAIIDHIFSGHCFLNQHSECLPACKMFTADFSSETEFFTYLDSLIAKSKTGQLPVEKLKSVLEALSITEQIRPIQPR